MSVYLYSSWIERKTLFFSFNISIKYSFSLCNSSYLLNNTFSNINVNTTSNFEINNESYKNLYENKRYIETEINEEKTNELNKKFLKIKENYYKCLDNRYQLKSALKSDISKIYKIKAKIKKIKKQQNIEKNSWFFYKWINFF